MMNHAERVREAQRHRRPAEHASASRLRALDTFGLRYSRVDDFNVIVEGDYTLNLAFSFWRSIDGSRQGYLVSSLRAEIKGTLDSEKPVTGRDSIASDDTGKTSPPAIAESVTGSILSGGVSTELLPAVWP